MDVDNGAKERTIVRESRGVSRRSIQLAGAVAVVGLAALAVVGSAKTHLGWHRDDSDAGWRNPGSAFRHTASDRREQVWTLPGGKGKVVIDDVAGDVIVRGTTGDQVRLVAKQSRRARTAEDLDLAAREMPLRLSQHGDTVIAYVDSPFRDGEGSFRGPSRDVDYRVIWDFDVEVPRGAEVVLRTALEGRVSLEGTDGRFEVRNVNGDVSVRDVGGAGKVTTVNGELAVRFRRNPDGPCEFANVNGDVDVTFQPALAAEVRFRTLNGDGWSDFPFTVMPRQATVERNDRREGRFVLKSEWQEGIRIGGGGPLLSFATVNGDVLIRNAANGRG